MPLLRKIAVLFAAMIATLAGGVVLVAPAQAAVIPNAITGITITETNATYYQDLTINVTWCIPDAAQAGDTFWLDLPPALQGLNRNFTLVKPDTGEVLANAVYDPATNRVTFTITDVAEELNRVCGRANFKVETVKNLIDVPGPNDFHFDTNTQDFDDTVNIDGPQNNPGGRPAKSGRWANLDQNRLIWDVQTGAGPFATARMVDTVGPGQAIDCTSVRVEAGPIGDYRPGPAAGRFTIESCSAAQLVVSFEAAVAGEGFQVKYEADVTDMTLRTYTNSVLVTIDGEDYTVRDDEERTEAGGEGDGDLNPAIDIEKWSTEDGYPAGDFDTAPGKVLSLGDPEPITMTITNTGEENLRDVNVTDATDAGPSLTGLSCDFSALGGPATGTTWAGPFAPEATFDCTATLPAMQAGLQHSDTATVIGTGRRTGTEVTDNDPWHGRVDATPDIDIEKWSTDDGLIGGDFDDEPGKPLPGGTPQSISMTITNDGNEALVDIKVSDATLDGPALTGLSCDFSALGGPATGVSWAGPFNVGDSFECTATLPAMSGGQTHSDEASVDGAGQFSGVAVKDTDEWHGHVPPKPGIDIEKWSTEQGPTDGDFDDAPGLEIQPGTPTPITMTITNTGNEPLLKVRVSDKTNEGLALIDLTCDFSKLGGPSTGTSWKGPFQPGDSFACTATLPAMPGDEIHADTAKVDGAGQFSGATVDDEDKWHGRTTPTSVAPEGPEGPEGLPNTGGPSLGLAVLGSLLSVFGALILLRRRYS